MAGYTYENRGLGIGNLDYGVSTDGAVEYFKSLQTQLLTGVCDRIDDIQSITDALNKGWQGVARDRFDDQFRKAREQVKGDLMKEYNDLVSKLSELVTSFVEQDANMIINE